jgi:hypothetical protein
MFSPHGGVSIKPVKSQQNGVYFHGNHPQLQALPVTPADAGWLISVLVIPQ